MTEQEYNERAAHITAVFEKGELFTRDGRKLEKLNILPPWVNPDYPLVAKINHVVSQFKITGENRENYNLDLIIPPFQPAAPQETNGSIKISGDKLAEFWAKLPNHCEGLATPKNPEPSAISENEAKSFLELASVSQNAIDSIKFYEPSVDTFAIIQKWLDRYPDADLSIRADDHFLIIFWPKSSNVRENVIIVIKDSERDAVLEFDRKMNEYRNQ